MEISISGELAKETRRYEIRTQLSVEAIAGSMQEKSGPPRITATPAEFEVRGIANRNYSVGLPYSVTARAMGVQGASIEVTNLFAESRINTSTPGEFKLGDDGTDRFQVGGILETNGHTVPARYIAEVPVTVHYE